MTERKKEIVFVSVLFVFTFILYFLPTGFSNKNKMKSTRREKVEIIETDNSEVSQHGIVRVGEQVLKVKILTGKFKGEEFEAVNNLMGKMEFDKIFQVKDRALATLDLNRTETKVIFVNVIDHYRINLELILFAMFAMILLLYSGWTGLKSLLSFVITILLIWKILIPGFLKGLDPVILSFVLVTVMTAIVVYLVAGINKKGHVAFWGSVSGIFFTLLLSVSFGKLFKLSGAIKPFSETLLYSGFSYLNLDKILFAGIFLASSGAVMDIAMDISASMNEIKEKKPDIDFKELTMSGLSVGRAVVGTMTTTLLLAYSGGYMALLMVFMGQGTPIINIFNLTYVSGEILHTLVGSFGLILVAPITAVIGGFVYSSFKIKKRVRRIINFNETKKALERRKMIRILK